MTPAALQLRDFDRFPRAGRSFAAGHLPLLRRLPLAICPSFLLQIRGLPTSFPRERASLEAQSNALESLSPAALASLLAPLEAIRIPEDLAARDWLENPADFISRLTAYLWSSSQITAFRDATEALFAALPATTDSTARLVITVLGRGAQPTPHPFGKLRANGILLTNLHETNPADTFLTMLRSRSANSPDAYAHWYVDGGDPWPSPISAGLTQTSFPALFPLRARVLSHMRDTIVSGDAGAEAMHDRLSGLTPAQLGAAEISPDPVLQRFFTELFTLSSGPQIFSTSFVQWAGRELMRRAAPHTLLLRYGPRQHHRPFNESVGDLEAEKILDPEGSLRDAEMGSFYAWLEARRATPSGKLVFLSWLEGTSNLLLLSPTAPAGKQTNAPLSLAQALSTFS